MPEKTRVSKGGEFKLINVPKDCRIRAVTYRTNVYQKK